PARVPKLRRQVALRIAELVRSKVPSVVWQGELLFIVPSNVLHGRLMEVLESISTDHPFGGRLVVGVGSVVEGLASSGESLRQSIAAARSWSNEEGRGTVIHYPDVALEVLLASNQDVMRTIIEHRLGALLETKDLHQTIAAFLDNGRLVSRAAEALGVHPNTVSYRLRQIETTAGIDIHNSHDLAVMDIALLALRVLRSQTHE
ncbi:MAG: helix-turn-helix domain-containing protein, partial [Ilumatobacteraceae bacterium]